MAAVECGWFDEAFLGDPVRQDLDGRGAFELHDDDTVASVVDEYDEQIDGRTGDRGPSEEGACRHLSRGISSNHRRVILHRFIHRTWGQAE